MKIQEAASISATAVKEWSGAMLAIGAVLFAVLSWIGTTFHVGFTLPWDGFEAKAEALTTKFDAQQQTIQKQQQQLDIIIQQSQQQGCDTWQLLRDRYKKDQDDAQAELNVTPTSVTLQRARDEAKAKVEKYDIKLHAAPCV
jgi:hypothetical protein